MGEDCRLFPNCVDGKLRNAFLASLFVHILMLGSTFAPPHPERMVGGGFLNVHLGTHPSPGKIRGLWNQGTLQQETPPSDILRHGKSTASISLPAPDVSPESPSPKMNVHATAGSMAYTGNGGARARSVQQGKVNAVLIIDDGGNVREILWQEIPPLTGDQLQLLEKVIRQRIYPPRGQEHTVSEVVDIWAHLAPH